ncbi:MAG TPA: sodium:proton antiporter [Xanthobacteraceae bacterium]|nr:sodium:proton antiporter [Xanthobacteraceae bacterium]
MQQIRVLSLILIATIAPNVAHAAGLDGTALGWPWALPFAGILLTIAAGPLLFPRLWHHHYGKFAFVWGTLAIVPIAALYDVPTATAAFVHALLAEYLSFIVLLFTLYVVAGGILVTGELRGTPLTNTAILALGTLIASIVGTTGAAMILIRPLLRANANRLHNAHVVVFFIILVANVGGALSPLGDPPLFVGFLRGVEFFWTAQHLWLQTAILAAIVLAMFVVVDIWFHRQDKRVTLIGEPPLPPDRLSVQGSVNFLLLAGIIAVILIASQWKPGIAFEIYGTKVQLQELIRDGTLIAIAILSLVLTPNQHRDSNGFTWEPIREVAILFAGIFACIVPVLAMLQAGRTGAFGWLPQLIEESAVPNAVAYFWLTGILSAFLDNAPTYLVFFELGGGNAQTLMGPLAPTLAAISMGAVYMGALTYIGNAPNLMIYAIAQERGIKMPSFVGYMLWASLILLPGLLLITFFFLVP